MRYENAVRKTTPALMYQRLHLVTPESIAAMYAIEPKAVEAPKIIRRTQARRNERLGTIGLGIAAISAPAIWIGHALLHHMHVL